MEANWWGMLGSTWAGGQVRFANRILIFPSSQAITSGVGAPVELPRSIEDFDLLLQDDLKPFSDLGQKLGGLIAEQVS